MKRRHPSRPAVVLIPALDEAATIASVIAVARAAAVGPVVVIDDGSTDDTAEVAIEAGAEVLRLKTNHGKGGALAAGARARREAVVVLLDADLTGLRPQHVRALVQPVATGRADMTRGVFVGGRWATALAQRMLPVLNGQRALLRESLLSVPGLADSRYGVEIAIAEQAKSEGWATLDVPLPGVSQVVKEEKRGFVRGVLVRLRMYAEIMWAYLQRLSRRWKRAGDARARAGGARSHAGQARARAADARRDRRHAPAAAQLRGLASHRKVPRR